MTWCATDPNIEMIVTQDIEMTSDVNHADIAFACNSWMEFTYPEMTATVSNWVQVEGRHPAVVRHPQRSRHVCRRREVDGNHGRQADARLHFVYMNRVDVYVQRMLDASTLYGYSADVMLKSEKGWMVMTGPIRAIRSGKRPTKANRVDARRPVRIPDRTGDRRGKLRRAPRGPEATPYLPNAIMSTNPYVRPDDYGIPSRRSTTTTSTCATSSSPGEIKRNQNPLWEKGYQFYCVTPKTRHRVHSQWSVNDWVQIYESNFGDPYRMDKRTPGVGEHQLHINPQAAKDRGINDGDYVYVDGNPVDRPYRGWKPSDPFYKVARLMIR